MTFLRPTATKTLSRWAESFVMAMGLGLFAFLAIGSTGVILPMVYGMVTLVCAVTLFVAVRRARVAGDTAANSGHVQVDERQITYFHLGQSWSVSLNDLTSVVIETTDDGPINDDIFWEIRDLFGSVVRIPNTAGGNETLFDAVSALDRVSFEQISTAMASTAPAIFTVWLANGVN
jgi:hypothetical protein